MLSWRMDKNIDHKGGGGDYDGDKDIEALASGRHIHIHRHSHIPPQPRHLFRAKTIATLCIEMETKVLSWEMDRMKGETD